MELSSVQLTFGSIAFLVSVLGGMSGLYQIFIKPRLDKTNKIIDTHNEEVKKTLVWRTDMEARVKSLENSDNRIFEGLSAVQLGIEHIQKEAAEQHAQTNQVIQGEVRRLEDRVSEDKKDIFKSIEDLRNLVLEIAREK